MNPICANTAGSTVNSADCACGSTTCTSSSGLYCTSSANSCNVIPICNDGQNSLDCVCGSTTCTSSTGRHCVVATSTCTNSDQLYAKLFQDSNSNYYYEVILQIKRVGATTACISDNGNDGIGTSCEGNAYTSNNCCGSGNDCTTNARPCTDTDRPLNWYKLGASATTTTPVYKGTTSIGNWANFFLNRGEKYAVIAKDSYGDGLADGWHDWQLQISTSTAQNDNIIGITVENTNSGWFAYGHGGTAGYLVYNNGWKFAHSQCGVFTTTNAETDNDSQYTPSVKSGETATDENKFTFTCTSGSPSGPAICSIDTPNSDCGNTGVLENNCISPGASWNSATCD